MHSDTPELVHHYQCYATLQTCLHNLVELSGHAGNLGKELCIIVRFVLISFVIHQIINKWLWTYRSSLSGRFVNLRTDCSHTVSLEVISICRFHHYRNFSSSFVLWAFQRRPHIGPGEGAVYFFASQWSRSRVPARASQLAWVVLYWPLITARMDYGLTSL